MADSERDTVIHVQSEEAPDITIPNVRHSDSTNPGSASPQATTRVVTPEIQSFQPVPGEYDMRADRFGPLGEGVRFEDHNSSQLSPSKFFLPSETEKPIRINVESNNRANYTPRNNHRTESYAVYEFPSEVHPGYASAPGPPNSTMPWTNATPIGYQLLPPTFYPPGLQPSFPASGDAAQNPFHTLHRPKAHRLSQSGLPLSRQDEISGEGPHGRHSSRPSVSRTGTHESDHNHNPRMKSASRRGTYESRQSNSSGIGGMGLPLNGMSAIWPHEPRQHQQYQQPVLITMPSWERTHYGSYQQMPPNTGRYWPGIGPNFSATATLSPPMARNYSLVESPSGVSYDLLQRQRTCGSQGTREEAISFNQPSRRWHERAHPGQLSHDRERVPSTSHEITASPTIHTPPGSVPSTSSLPTNAANSRTENMGSASIDARPVDAPTINSLTTPVDPVNILLNSSVPRMEGAPGPLGSAESSAASDVPASVAQTAPAAQNDVERQDVSSFGDGTLRQPTLIQRLRRALLRKQPFWRRQKSTSTLATMSSDENTSRMWTVCVYFVEFIRTIAMKFYLMLLLFLPVVYFTRVGRLFEEARLAMSEIEQMAFHTGLQALGYSDEQDPVGTEASPMQWTRLQSAWEHFIGSLLREWKTLNVISALLLRHV